MFRMVYGAALATAVAGAAACSSASAPESLPGQERVGEAEGAVTLESTFNQVQSGVPLPGMYLEFARSTTGKGGLIEQQYLQANGIPVPGQLKAAGQPVSPTDEAETYYAAIGSGWVPSTLEDWKAHFHVPTWDRASESLKEFRKRNHVVVYYNKNELGLGRELGCGEWFVDTNGRKGVACYVTNYGTAFGDAHNSMVAAIDGNNAKNTVCIVYRPALPKDQQVQFYVFDGHGSRQDWAQLDTLGPRKHPQICTNCHGGVYDDSSASQSDHLVTGARFLPVDPNVVEFEDTLESPKPAYTYSRSEQEESLRRINQIAMGTDAAPVNGDPIQHQDTPQLTSLQRMALVWLYDGHIDTASPSQQPGSTWVPWGWSATAASRDIYTKVVKPYCATCHYAVGSESMQQMFLTEEGFRNQLVLRHVCTNGGYLMPQAQQTMNRFWDNSKVGQAPNEQRLNPVEISGLGTFDSPADALLAVEFGMSRDQCTGYQQMISCVARGRDSICGDAHSGTACNPAADACVPNITFMPAEADLTVPVGVCKYHGDRGCPKGQECRPAYSAPSYGYDGLCYTCGGDGQPLCWEGGACALPRYVFETGAVTTCRACGKHDQPVCQSWAGDPCDDRHIVYGTTCKACGRLGGPACPGATPCDGTYANDGGICVECGLPDGPVCAGDEPCNDPYHVNQGGRCAHCGDTWQPACTSGVTCNFPNIPAGDGICHACYEGGACESPVFRRFNGTYHLHTLSTSDAGDGSYWPEPGNEFYVQRQEAVGTIPLYGCRRLAGGYFYTTSASCEGGDGTWASNQGILGYVGKLADDGWSCSLPGSTRLYRLHNPLTSDHFYTASNYEAWNAYWYYGYQVETSPGCVWVHQN
jgi:hypothetical protein